MTQFKKVRTATQYDKQMVDRLVADPRSVNGPNGELVKAQTVANIFRRSVRDVSDIRNIFKVMPWLHLPREILISSITSPGDMIKIKLNIHSKLKSIPPSLRGMLDQVLKTFFIDEQQLESKIYDWVDEAYIAKGSHPILIIPEASLDKLLGTKVSMEGMDWAASERIGNWYRPMGLIGIPTTKNDRTTYASFESNNQAHTVDVAALHTIRGTYNNKKGDALPVTYPFNITDNLAILRAPLIQEKREQQAVEMAYGKNPLQRMMEESLSIEAKERAAKEGPTDTQIYKHFFKKTKSTNRSRIAFVANTTIEENQGYGHPLPYHLPPESVIPCFIPGDVSNHTRYIIILDGQGYPVSYTRQLDFYDDVRSYMSNNGSEQAAAGDILQLAKENISGTVQDVSNDEIDRITSMNSGILQQDIVQRLNSGISGGEFKVSFPDTVNRMLLSFAMANEKITFLVVPAEYMIYMAYEYNEFGVGKSALEDGKGLAAQAASVHVANVLGQLQNAIPGKDINIQLDPNDRNPKETVIFEIGEAMSLAYRDIPFSVTSLAGMTDQLQRSGFNVNVSGNSRYPELKTSITPRESQQVVIDPELKQSLKDELYNLFGLTSEMVDNVNQPGFAVTAVNQSILLLKRVMVGQAKTNPFLADYVRTFTYNSGILIKRLIAVLEDNKKDIPKEYTNNYVLLDDYLSSVYCDLPEPQTENIAKEAEVLKTLDESVETFLDAYFKEEFLGGIDDPTLVDAYPVIRENLKGMLLRQYMRQHGIFRDLDIFQSGEDDQALVNIRDEMLAHTEILRAGIGDYAEKIADFVISRKKRMSKITEKVNKAKEGEDEVLSGTDLAPGGDTGDFESVPLETSGEEDEEALGTTAQLEESEQEVAEEGDEEDDKDTEVAQM